MARAAIRWKRGSQRRLAGSLISSSTNAPSVRTAGSAAGDQLAAFRRMKLR